ncbi:TPA: dUTPase, partial [Staphylococcus aureus]|nr:dUTPase [Staphylococcus aureus]
MNNLTVDQLKELLQIQKEFDDRIPTLNLRDSKIAYVVEFFEWFNTLETFKNWKKKPGKPLDVQLDELADMLAFGLSIANQSGVSLKTLEKLIPSTLGKAYFNTSSIMKDFMEDFVYFGLGEEDSLSLPLNIA